MNRMLSIVALAGAAVLLIGYVATHHSGAGAATPAASATLKKATFAGGCFWCSEADFEKADGVVDAVSGYTGGKAEDASYEKVSSGRSGHLECVQVTYDPAKISYDRLLDIFWRHVDPTDGGGQFADRGARGRAGHDLRLDLRRLRRQVGFLDPGGEAEAAREHPGAATAGQCRQRSRVHAVCPGVGRLVCQPCCRSYGAGRCVVEPRYSPTPASGVTFARVGMIPRSEQSSCRREWNARKRARRSR